MKLHQRYNRLTLWNKLGMWGALASIIAIPLALVLYHMSENTLTSSVRQLIVDDVIVSTYPPQIDFRIHNPGSATIAVSKVLFKVLEHSTGPSPIGKQEPSEIAELMIDASVDTGDMLEVPISVKVPGHDTDRIVINVAWAGPTPDIGHFYVMVPALKSSEGYIRCNPITVHIQEDFEKSKDRYASQNPDMFKPAILMDDSQAMAVAISWAEEEPSARLITVGR